MKPHHRITGIYLIVGLLWILLSDRALQAVFHESDGFTWAQTIKGMAFVLVTGTMLYLLIRSHVQRQEAAEQEKRALFLQTMRAVNHILNNFLNNMQYFKLTAEESSALEPSVIDEYDTVIHETAAKIRDLSAIESLDETALAAHMGPDAADRSSS